MEKMKKSMKDPMNKAFAVAVPVQLGLTFIWRKVALDKWGTEKDVPVAPALGMLIAIMAAGAGTWFTVYKVAAEKEKEASFGIGKL